MRIAAAVFLGLTLHASAADAPAPPQFGQPGEKVFAVTIPLKHPKKSEDQIGRAHV